MRSATRNNYAFIPWYVYIICYCDCALCAAYPRCVSLSNVGELRKSYHVRTACWELLHRKQSDNFSHSHINIIARYYCLRVIDKINCLLDCAYICTRIKRLMKLVGLLTLNGYLQLPTMNFAMRQPFAC